MLVPLGFPERHHHTSLSLWQFLRTSEFRGGVKTAAEKTHLPIYEHASDPYAARVSGDFAESKPDSSVVKKTRLFTRPSKISLDRCFRVLYLPNSESTRIFEDL